MSSCLKKTTLRDSRGVKTRESAKISPVARRHYSPVCLTRATSPAKKIEDNSPSRIVSNEQATPFLVQENWTREGVGGSFSPV